jgi:hypothetical protein
LEVSLDQCEWCQAFSSANAGLIMDQGIHPHHPVFSSSPQPLVPLQTVPLLQSCHIIKFGEEGYSTKDWTQALTLARQSIYHLSFALSPERGLNINNKQ